MLEMKSLDRFYRTSAVTDHRSGVVRATPRSYQTVMLNYMDSATHGQIVCGRQMGRTFLLSVYAAWFAMVNPNVDVRYVTLSYETQREMIQNVRTIINNMPRPSMWRPGHIATQTGVTFTNGSSIHCGASCIDGADLLLVEDVNYMLPRRASILQYKSLSARSIMMNTKEVNVGRQDAPTLQVPWHLHPHRNTAWATRQIEILGADRFRDEYNCGV